MERIFDWMRKSLLLMAGLVLGTSVFAGTLLAPPALQEVPSADEQQYPESRFGKGPAKFDTGIRAGYASRAVEEMETADEPVIFRSGTPKRSPAGLMEESAIAAQGAPAKESKMAREMPSERSNDAAAILRKGVQEIAVIAGDLGFFPKTFFVNRDVPVRLFVTGASKNTLCIMMDTFQVRKQVRSQKIEEITFTPSMPGKYRFHCPVNGMEGTMIVREFASSASGSGE